MAEFIQTMKNWRRMCKSYSQCGACPLYKHDPSKCGRAVERTEQLLDKLNYGIVEVIVTRWAAEHPEPVYPSVAEYLEQFGIIIRRDGTMEADFFKANEPMSKTLAEKLGIEPKEG